MKRLVYYVTGHGLGHAVRTTQVINALQRMAPDLKVQIRTPTGPEIFEANLDPMPEFVRLAPKQALDVGLIQLDSLRPDLAATLAALESRLENAETIIDQEKKALEAFGADVVAADAPFLAPAAARAAGAASALVTNFTWDWIYEAYLDLDPRWPAVVDQVTRYCRMADLVVRLPMAPEMTDRFRRVVSVGWTGRKATRARSKIRDRLGLAQNRKMALLTFNQLEIGPESAEKMAEQAPEYLFVYSADLNLPGSRFQYVSPRDFHYPDLIGAADVVLTKPGYGITADCLANGAPMLYTDRGVFPEYPYLVEAIENRLAHRFIPSDELYAGRIGEYIHNLDPPKGPGREALAFTGADDAARLLLDLAD